MKQRIEKKLTEKFSPQFLQVINNSNLHAGHLGDDGSGETHFMIKINSESLVKLRRVEAHRKINEALKEEFSAGLHALEIRIGD